MSRPQDPRKKVATAPGAPPLQHNAFAALDQFDALKNLVNPASPPAPVAPAPFPAAARPEALEPAAAVPPLRKRGRLVLRRETKERGGKVVVVISGLADLPGSNAVLIGNLARELKGKLGCGGTFDRQEIVLQGDRCEEVTALLESLNFRVEGVRRRPS